MDLARWWNSKGMLGRLGAIALERGFPIENKRQFLDVNPDVLEQVDPIFFGDLRQAAFKALGVN